MQAYHRLLGNKHLIIRRIADIAGLKAALLSAVKNRAFAAACQQQYIVTGFKIFADGSIIYANSVNLHAFEAYPWPGNVRELKNFVEYGVGFCEHGVLTLDLMDSRFKTASPPPVKTEKGMPSPPPGPARDTAEYDRIMQLLGRYGQHTEGKKRTASELGISLATLYRRMGQLGITARKHAR